ncbi:hypothetical protein DV735_g2572, partial [Chaetothyriales sp. CBS 134920]
MALALLPPPHRNSHNPFNYRDPSPQLRRLNMDSHISSRPSLPSISSLIEAVADHTESRNPASPDHDRARRISAGSQNLSRISPDRPTNPSPRSCPPPTPPLPPASSFDFPPAPAGSASPTSAPGRNSFYHTTPSSTSPQLYAQRNSSYPHIPDTATSYPPIPDPNQWPAPRPVTDRSVHETPHASPPTPTEQHEDGRLQGLNAQKSLPTNFPPPVQSRPGPPPIDPQMATTPTWQHHHYYPPANPPSYPQTQERYICLTCSKPFSRPSSLKIHTYSHTGEKPYKSDHTLLVWDSHATMPPKTSLTHDEFLAACFQCVKEQITVDYDKLAMMTGMSKGGAQNKFREVVKKLEALTPASSSLSPKTPTPKKRAAVSRKRKNSSNATTTGSSSEDSIDAEDDDTEPSAKKSKPSSVKKAAGKRGKKVEPESKEAEEEEKTKKEETKQDGGE